MKTTMASAALLLVLALAVVSAPLTAEAKKKKAESAAGGTPTKAENSFCGTLCTGKKGVEYVLCKDSCDIQQKANLVTYSRIQCNGKCTEQKGITKEGMVVCQEQCSKEYKVKAAEVAATCNKVCAMEKNPKKKETCIKQCTPPS